MPPGREASQQPRGLQSAAISTLQKHQRLYFLVKGLRNFTRVFLLLKGQRACSMLTSMNKALNKHETH